MNWEDRIKEAEQKGSFDPEDVELAGSFTTCAVAEAFGVFDKPLPYGALLGRVGNDLYQLGLDFYDAIKDNQMHAAKDLLDEIKEVYDTRWRESAQVQP